MVGEKTARGQCALAGEGHLRRLGLGPNDLRIRRRAAPAEDHEVGALLADGLDHPIGGVAADADQGPQLDPLLVAEVEDALEEAARGARLGRALGEADPLRHLDDAERGDLGRAPVGNPRADADEVARRARVGERQEDPVRRAASGGHRIRPPASAAHLAPAGDEVRLELLELARLVVDHPLRLVGVDVERVADEPRGAPKVQRGEGGQQPLAIDPGPVEGDERVVEAAHPELGAEVEVGRVAFGVEPHDPFELLGAEHLGPHLALGQPGLVEVVDQLGVVDLDLLRRDDPLEAVLGDRVRALHAQPSVLVVAGQLEERADHLAEHRPQVGGRILGVVDLGAQPRLAHGEALVDGAVRHPDVDPEARRQVVERVELEVAADEVAARRAKSPPIGWRMRVPYSARVSG